ncbi:hypothetical protein QA599_15590 [Haloarculaceae archaeon H-GB1-1]|nr:hypothetical protein [Haloarculaceae archaeon H-GB1-1]
MPTDSTITVRNVVRTGDLNREFDLAVLAVRLEYESCEYDPESFPELLYHPQDHDALLAFFQS